MSLFVDYFRVYASYNVWANQQIMDSVSAVSDDLYYGRIFPESRTIHEILNHILVMDRVWLAELHQIDAGIQSGTQILCDTREALITERRRTDDEITTLINGLTEADLDTVIEYGGETTQRWPWMLEIAHVFRHQVHHRGQLSVLLQNAGVPMPKLDDLFIPEGLDIVVVNDLTATA